MIVYFYSASNRSDVLESSFKSHNLVNEGIATIFSVWILTVAVEKINWACAGWMEQRIHSNGKIS